MTCITNTYSHIESVRSCDQKPYMHNAANGGICIKIEVTPQKNISLLQDGCRFSVYYSNMAAVTSCEHTLHQMMYVHLAEVDECNSVKGVCHQDCVNTPTGYRCTCSHGYELDDNGVSCSGINKIFFWFITIRTSFTDQSSMRVWNWNLKNHV